MAKYFHSHNCIIKREHRKNPFWSPERLHAQLVSLGLTDIPATNTIAKHLPKLRKSPNERVRQAWRTFLINHRHEIWAMDFFTVPILFFQVLCVLVIISHDWQNNYATLATATHRLATAVQDKLTELNGRMTPMDALRPLAVR